MGKKILDSKLLYVVLSVILSVTAWLYVTSLDSTWDSLTITGIPVTINDREILEGRELMIINENITVNIRVRATPMVLAKLNNETVKVSASVRNITMEGTHPVNYTVGLPSGITEGQDVEISYGLGGSAVNVEVARSLSRKVRIQGRFQGTPAEGYLAGNTEDFRFIPEEITVSGRAERVNQVSYAEVVVTGEGLTENVNQDFPFQLIGVSGEPLDLDVTCDVDMIYTLFPIRATAEIPLEVKVVEGGGLSREDVRVRASAKSITVAGSQEAVAALANEGGLLVGIIDLASLEDEMAENGGELTFPIPLADELENLSGITEVTVTLSMLKKVETRSFDVTSRIGVTNTPEGWTPTIITQVLPVKVRGPAALLDELTEENIQVVANLKEIQEAAGQYTVPVNVYLHIASSATEVGVVKANYTIVVSLEQET